MQPEPLGTASVETVTVLLAGLEITLTARRAGGSATVEASVEGSPPSASETQSPWVDPADEDLFLISAWEGIPFRNSIYICLRTSGNCTVGFWTASYAVYWARVRSNVANEFHPDSISHAFASRAEAEAYLRGARRIWPPQAA